MSPLARRFLFLAGANGFLAVALGAFAAHGLESVLTENALATFDTGVQYHMTHSLALFGTGLLCLTFARERSLVLAGNLFMLGILMFSGSLYGLSLSGQSWLGFITPLGGVCFLAAWASLSWFALGRGRGQD